MKDNIDFISKYLPPKSKEEILETIKEKSENNYEVLIRSTKYGLYEGVKLALDIREEGYNEDISDIIDAIKVNAQKGHLNILKLFLERYGDLAIKNNERDVLYLIVLHNNYDMLKYLLDNNFINKSYIQNRFLTDLAIGNSNFEMIKLLKEYGGILHSKFLVEAVNQKNIQLVKYLINQDLDVKHLYDTPLRTAILQESVDIYKYLKKHGADLNDIPDIKGIYAYLKTQRKNTEILKNVEEDLKEKP